MAGFSGSTGVSQKQMTDAIAQSTAILQKKATIKKIIWSQTATAGTEYTNVVDINAAQSDFPQGGAIIFVSAMYNSGRPSGLRIGVASTETGDVSFVQKLESDNYRDLSNGMFHVLDPGVKRIIIQEKIEIDSGKFYGQAILLS